jgi:hypothetical protein
MGYDQHATHSVPSDVERHLTVAIRNCPLAASGYPMTATTECGGPKGRLFDDDGHGPGVRGHACVGLGVVAELPGPRAQGQPTFKP